MSESLNMITNLGLVLFVMTTMMAIRLRLEVKLIKPGLNQATENFENQKEK